MNKSTFEELLNSPPAGIAANKLKELRDICLAAQSRAYCPYSKFHVGCSLLTDSSDQKIFEGHNVENAAYTACICAERAAITTAVVSGYLSFKAIMIVTDSQSCASPCGVCRQVIREFGKDTVIFMLNKTADQVVTTSLQTLLPLSFGPDDLT